MNQEIIALKRTSQKITKRVEERDKAKSSLFNGATGKPLAHALKGLVGFFKVEHRIK